MRNEIAITHSVFSDAKVIRDSITNKSKGYGFVSFVNKKVCV